MAKIFNVRLSNPIGDTIMSTAVLRGLRNALRYDFIDVYTKHPELLVGNQSFNAVRYVDKPRKFRVDVDLYDYIEKLNPLVTQPNKHLIAVQFDIAEVEINRRLASLGRDPVSLPRWFVANLHFTQEERMWAVAEYKKLAKDKPLVWLQMKTSTKAKDWDDTEWQRVQKLASSCNFVDLTNYSIRNAIALAAVCDAGVTLDTYALHGAAAVGAQNVIGVMISSPWGAVGYPGQTPVDGVHVDAAWTIAATLVNKIFSPDGKETRNGRRQMFAAPGCTWA